MNAKPILAFDCATTGATVALNVNGQIHTRTIGNTRQAAELVPAIDELMKENQTTYRDLGCIVTTLGPGSFTGVRIGLAALHGFALVVHTPIKLLTTLEAMAWDAITTKNALESFYIALRAGKSEIYAQKFLNKEHHPVANGEIFLTPETRMEWDAPCFSNHIAADASNYILGPDASILCQIADTLPPSTLANAAPLYIRPPDAIAPQTPEWLKRASD